MSILDKIVELQLKNMKLNRYIYSTISKLKRLNDKDTISNISSDEDLKNLDKEIKELRESIQIKQDEAAVMKGELDNLQEEYQKNKKGK